MEEKLPRAHMKRPLPEDDDSEKPPAQKRVRFPKGKKVKPGVEVVDLRTEDAPNKWNDPLLAAKDRMKRRSQMTAELFSEENRGMIHDISAAEVRYEDNETFVDDQILIEPFNLTKEREEGYFDADGNYVEYVNDNEIKDAWLDSVDVDPKLAERGPMVTDKEEDVDLSAQEIGKTKRRIADVLEPGETVLQGLRRLKGTSNNKKEKMSAETKFIFDQLTEDAVKLMENGDYNVYDEKREVFEREAEGYERLAQIKGGSTSVTLGQGESEFTMVKDFISNGTDFGGASSVLLDTAMGPSNLNVSTAETSSSKGDDAFDIFAEDDENATSSLTSEVNNLVSGSNPDSINQPSERGDLQNDYVYDESSGYYYSSTLGYYYDPSSRLYCCAASGQWYSYNEETGSYDEIQEAASNLS